MSPYRTILVAYDGTGASDVALQQGAALARAANARLHVLAVVVTSGGLLLDPAVVPGNLMLIEQTYLERAMTAAVRNLGEKAGSVSTCVRDGDAAVEIVMYAREIAADLVVIGHSEKGLLASWLDGATSRHLLAHLPCSTLIAHGGSLEPGDTAANASRTAIDPGTLPCGCAAAVLWLPEGETPNDIAHFKAAARLNPSQHDRTSWWSLEQAISDVQTSNSDPGKRPWIKVGDIVLSPTDIGDLHNFYRHHGTRK